MGEPAGRVEDLATLTKRGQNHVLQSGTVDLTQDWSDEDPFKETGESSK